MLPRLSLLSDAAPVRSRVPKLAAPESTTMNLSDWRSAQLDVHHIEHHHDDEEEEEGIPAATRATDTDEAEAAADVPPPLRNPALVPMHEYLASLHGDAAPVVATKAVGRKLIPIGEYMASLRGDAVPDGTLIPIGEYLAMQSKSASLAAAPDDDLQPMIAQALASKAADTRSLIPLGEYLAKRSKSEKAKHDDDTDSDSGEKKKKKKKKWYQFWKDPMPASLEQVALASSDATRNGLRIDALRHAVELETDAARRFYMDKINALFAEASATKNDYATQMAVAKLWTEARDMDNNAPVAAEASSFIQAMQALKLDSAAAAPAVALDKYGVTQGRDAAIILPLAIYTPTATIKDARARTFLESIAALEAKALFGTETESEMTMEGEIKDAGVNLFKLATIAGPSRRLGNIMARTYKAADASSKIKEFVLKTEKLQLSDLVKEKKKKKGAESVFKGGQFGLKFFTRTSKGKETNKWKWYFQLFLDDVSNDAIAQMKKDGNFIVYTNQSKERQPLVAFRFVQNYLYAVYVHYEPGRTMMAYDDSTTTMAAILREAIRSPTAQQMMEAALSHLSNQRATAPADLKTTMAANQVLAAAIHHLVRPALEGGAPAVGQRLHVTAPAAVSTSAMSTTTVAQAAQLQHALAMIGTRVVESGVPDYAIGVVVDDLGEALADGLGAQPQCLASVLSQTLHANMARVHSIYDSSDRVSILWDAPDRSGLAAFDYPLL